MEKLGQTGVSFKGTAYLEKLTGMAAKVTKCASGCIDALSDFGKYIKGGVGSFCDAMQAVPFWGERFFLNLQDRVVGIDTDEYMYSEELPALPENPEDPLY